MLPLKGGLLLLAVVFVIASPASAHGPCECLEPSSGIVGTSVQVPDSYRVTEVVWNPDPRDLENPALAEVYGNKIYRSASPTETLLNRPKAERGATFHIPQDVSPGRYMVVLFDGTEGGSHYTWETFKVVGGGGLPRTTPNLTPWLVGAGLLLVAGAFMLFVGRRSGQIGRVPLRGETRVTRPRGLVA